MPNTATRLKHLEAAFAAAPDKPHVAICFDRQDGSEVRCQVNGAWMPFDQIPDVELLLRLCRTPARQADEPAP